MRDGPLHEFRARIEEMREILEQLENLRIRDGGDNALRASRRAIDDSLALIRRVDAESATRSTPAQGMHDGDGRSNDGRGQHRSHKA